MKTYSQLFVDSGMMESILPRKLTSAAELRAFNPYLLDEEDDYDEADFEGINDVSTTKSYILICNFLGFP